MEACSQWISAVKALNGHAVHGVTKHIKSVPVERIGQS